MGAGRKEASMRYLCLLVGEPGMDGPVPGSPEFMQMLSDYQSATLAMATAGVLVDSAPLQPPSAATTLRVRDGEALLTDGPFAELKEQPRADSGGPREPGRRRGDGRGTRRWPDDPGRVLRRQPERRLAPGARMPG